MNEFKFDSIVINQKAEFKIKITSSMLDMFKEITGDVNPMHIDDSYAKEQGYESRLAYGMLTASFYSTLVGVYLPGKYCVFQECRTSFNKPVYVNDTLYISGEVIEIHEVLKRITIKAVIKNQKNDKVSKAILAVGTYEET
ncbi:MAG TPA: MaoC family dehydratase [Clostridiales bacterium]|nr:MaoC family dehydratase [Clostridiales bacterium]